MIRRVARAAAAAALLLGALSASAGAEYRVGYTFGAAAGGVAEDAAGNVYATVGDEVEKFSPTGDPVNRWTATGGNGIAVDRLGRVYVAEPGRDRIERFGPQGTLLGSLGIGLDGPEGVAVDDAGDVFIADTGHGRIVRLDADGAATTFAARTSPHGLAVDRAGDVYVADAAGIEKLSPAGALLATVGPGAATGVAVDADGDVYAAVAGAVVKLAPGGTTLATLAAAGARDVALDPDGSVIAAATDGLTRFVAVAPVTSITSAPSGLIEDTTATFSFSASIARSRFECRMAGDDFAPCASPFPAIGLAAGLNRFEVRAIDPQGIRERSPAVAEFSVDGAQGPPGFDGFDGLDGLDGERGPRGRRGPRGGLIVKASKPKALSAGAKFRVGLNPSEALRRVRVELRLGSSRGSVVANGTRPRLAAGRSTIVRLRIVRATTATKLVIVVHGRTARGQAVLLAKALR
jgi:sugar lactone lactonase YvrE